MYLFDIKKTAVRLGDHTARMTPSLGSELPSLSDREASPRLSEIGNSVNRTGYDFP